jgi:hypothetical protein
VILEYEDREAQQSLKGKGLCFCVFRNMIANDKYILSSCCVQNAQKKLIVPSETGAHFRINTLDNSKLQNIFKISL